MVVVLYSKDVEPSSSAACDELGFLMASADIVFSKRMM